MNRKIHFVYRPADGNVGDMACAPLLYFYDFFKRYPVLGHDVAHVNWLEIGPRDIVILGATGMFDLVEPFQRNIKRLYETTPNVIAWSVGFNSVYGSVPVETALDYNRFRLIGIRDFGHPSELPYLPCISCLAKELHKSLPVKRKIGIIENKAFSPLTEELPHEKISNESSLDAITDFIASSEGIFASSYHAVYWATLMGKPVVCMPFSTKFHWLKHKPVFYSGNLEDDFARAGVYQGALAEAASLNMDFFGRVKEIVLSEWPELPDSTYGKYYAVSKYVMADKLRHDLAENAAANLQYTMEAERALWGAATWLAARLDALDRESEARPLSVVCFGAGEMAGWIVPAFRPNRITIVAFVDERSGKNTHSFAGRPVIGLEEIAELDFDYILVACRPAHSVAQRLEESGVPGSKVVPLDFEALLDAASPRDYAEACAVAARHLRRFPGLIHAFDFSTVLQSPWLRRKLGTFKRPVT
jgi:hypothetical protein